MKTILVLLAALALASEIRCPEDNRGAAMTGRTRTNQVGRLMYEYKCWNARPHTFWVASSNQP